MITLHRKSSDDRADRIEERLRDLVLAYRTVTDESADPCFITEGDRKILPGEDMEEWFRNLAGELEWSRSLSGDGCYIDPDSGDVC
ncbi:hypothetical protein [Rhodohalobacter mucosus]|uniref:Uncharacterized protein n=1 Tax=Rhodohalobacter mucosus TaxID=2079485 RepID=A0A316TT46_9BACT|nr:hypothetical protein [Rhodohalobacter mucosus]PWN06145.1 hypothetical protein DDZ15_09885 [Rhodohalobacter mucosus]